MRHRNLSLLSLVCGFVVGVAPMRGFAGPQHGHAQASKPGAPAAASIQSAVCVLVPTAGSSCRGTIRFTQEGDVVKVAGDIEGLVPGQQHAIHIHEFGDCSATDAASAGSHYNPEGHPHGLPPSTERHAGDLGNLQADKDGKAHLEMALPNVSLAGAKNPVVGRAVIVHAKTDDGGQPVGNAGGRIACGVIGVAKAPESK